MARRVQSHVLQFHNEDKASVRYRCLYLYNGISMAKMRLDRFLAEAGAGTRSEVKTKIRAGRVKVNGEAVRKPETKTDPETDTVTVDGAEVSLRGPVYLMMNKPVGYVCATEDLREKTVLELLDFQDTSGLFPAGRLDKDTEGFLIITDDGRFAHDILSPRRHVSKTYFVIVTGTPDAETVRAFERGIDIGDEKLTKSAVLRFLTVDGDFIESLHTDAVSDSLQDSEQTFEAVSRCAESEEMHSETPGGGMAEKTASENPRLATVRQMKEFCLDSIALSDYARCGENECCCAVSITEGRYHQIKRMFRACGREVRFLKRIAMGTVSLDMALEAGQSRPLTADELKALGLRGDKKG